MGSAADLASGALGQMGAVGKVAQSFIPKDTVANGAPADPTQAPSSGYWNDVGQSLKQSLPTLLQGNSQSQNNQQTQQNFRPQIGQQQPIQQNTQQQLPSMLANYLATGRFS